MKIKLCYLCRSNERKLIHYGVRDNDAINVYKCDKCGLVYLDQQIDNLESFYVESGMRENDSQVGMAEIRADAYEDDYRRYQFVRDLIINRSLLDFGCGAGGFLQMAESLSRNVVGIELEKRMRQSINQDGIRCYESLDSAEIDMCDNPQKRVDIITMFHVLEHLRDPVDVLVRLKALLQPKGQIIIEVPNADDALLTLYNSKEFADFTYWSCHLYLYNNQTLRKLAEKAGLKVKYIQQIQRYPLANHLYWLSQRNPGGHKEWSMLIDEDLEKEYEKKLSRLGIADTIMMGLEP